MILSFDADAGIKWYNEHVKQPDEEPMTRKKLGWYLWGRDSSSTNNTTKLSKWKSGEVIPDLETYFAIKELLKCPNEVIVMPYEYEIDI